MRPVPSADVILNLHDLDLPSETVGTYFVWILWNMLSVPKAVEEAYRILKPEGILIMSSIMAFHIHAYPADYWRFSSKAIRSLSKPFETSFVDFAGKFYFPQTIIGVGFKENYQHTRALFKANRGLEKILKSPDKKQPTYCLD
jgi:SAM-dependent methyltransferase